MTRTEWRVIKTLGVLVLLVALIPVGAVVYRLVDNGDSNETLVSIAPALYTLVPGPTAPATLVPPTSTPMVVVLPAGWTQHAVPDQGFTVALPANWQRLPVKQEELEAALQVVRDKNPELAASLGASGQQLMQSGVKFWAFDLDSLKDRPVTDTVTTTNSITNNFVTNLTITRQTLPNPVSFDAYVLVNLNQISELSSRQGDVSHERTRLGALPAEKISYRLAFLSANGASTVSAITQYLLLNHSDSYVLTYATRPDQLEKYSRTFDQSAASFRLIGP